MSRAKEGTAPKEGVNSDHDSTPSIEEVLDAATEEFLGEVGAAWRKHACAFGANWHGLATSDRAGRS